MKAPNFDLAIGLQISLLTKAGESSQRSSIPMGADHSRSAAVRDVAIGQACSTDDEVFYAYLCRIPHLRLGWLEADGRRKPSDVTPKKSISAAEDAVVLNLVRKGVRRCCGW